MQEKRKASPRLCVSCVRQNSGITRGLYLSFQLGDGLEPFTLLRLISFYPSVLKNGGILFLPPLVNNVCAAHKQRIERSNAVRVFVRVR